MTPLNIVKILTAAAPIAASVASLANSNSENIERKEPSSVTNISITVNNNFYTKPERETINLANQMQDKLIADIFSGDRYKL